MCFLPNEAFLKVFYRPSVGKTFIALPRNKQDTKWNEFHFVLMEPSSIMYYFVLSYMLTQYYRIRIIYWVIANQVNNTD